ncbi:hypothetical protein NEOC95_000062 [Neochlamydia sp. AcF95]|nr:hypothetical protein [Neochlamydia sp. AcF95]
MFNLICILNVKKYTALLQILFKSIHKWMISIHLS